MSTDSRAWRVTLGEDAEILISMTQPVAVIRATGEDDRVVSWTDLDVGDVAVGATVFAAPDGAWVVYAPSEDDEGDLHRSLTTVHVRRVGPAARAYADGSRYAVGATRHGLWLRERQDPDPHERAAWSTDTELVVVAGGTLTTHSIDRRILIVEDVGDAPRLMFSPDAPDVREEHGGTSYHYRYATTPLPTGDLPEHLSAMRGAVPLSDEAFLAVLDRIGPDEVVDTTPDVPWPRIQLPMERRDAAISALVDEFGDLAHYWRGPGGEPRPLATGLSEPRIDIVGEWPDTRVEVTFRHPLLPDGRLRRALRVFDDAGRITPHPYASIHLMEDLDTHAPLPPSTPGEVRAF
ncbi:hypothetical protein [Microbacterium sp. 1P06AB]|uniref:hypothetical protein n=1 Tax=Microbacterium sp. 1P06AB TaxID=3132289 RepID=UPI0039A43682